MQLFFPHTLRANQVQEMCVVPCPPETQKEHGGHRGGSVADPSEPLVARGTFITPPGGEGA